MADKTIDLTQFGLELGQELGHGATGQVFRAEDREAAGRPVAVKLIKSTETDVLDSLAREVESVIRLRHPNIATLLRARTSAEPRFLVYELYQGQPSSLPLSEQSTADRGVRLCSALAAAHRMGVVHSDIKPANVLWNTDDQPLISDFGSARIEATTRFRLGIAFSPAWAAPWIRERGPGAADYASDVWSLAASLATFNQSEEWTTGPPSKLVQTDLLTVLQSAMPDKPPTGPVHADTALELGRQLQEYQHRRGWKVTPFPVDGQEDWAVHTPTQLTVHVEAPTQPPDGPPDQPAVAAAKIPAQDQQSELSSQTIPAEQGTPRRRRRLAVRLTGLVVAVVAVAALMRFVGPGLLPDDARDADDAVESAESAPADPTATSTSSTQENESTEEGSAAPSPTEEQTTTVTTEDQAEDEPTATTVAADAPLTAAIVFASDRSGTLDIFRVLPDGQVDAIVARDADDYSPTLSPDGTRVAFESNEEGSRAIYVAPVDGSTAPRRVSSSDAEAGGPAWSPDGTQIAWASRARGNWDIVIYDESTATETFVTTGASDDRNPAWSPDGQSVVFRSDRSGSGDIYALELASQRLTQLTTAAWREDNPSWSAGGSIAYEAQIDGDFDVFVLDVNDPTNPVRRTERLGPDRSPAFDQDRLLIIEQDGSSSSIVVEPGPSQHVIDSSTGLTSGLSIGSS